jgi:hypothetical protein
MAALDGYDGLKTDRRNSMPEGTNPYQIPQTEIAPVKPLVSGGLLTEVMLKYLKAASPWLRFIGILSYIGSGFLMLGGLAAMIILPSMGRFDTIVPGVEPFDRGMGAAFGAVYLVSGIFMFIPARFIYKFGSKIRGYFLSHREEDLEEALKNNKSFWKFYGILSVFILVGITGGIITGLVSALIR